MELTIEQALQQGVAAHKEGKLQEAEGLYRAIIQSQPEHPDANHNLGLIAISANEASAALSLFKIALDVNPKIEQFWLSYIDVLIKEKQFDNAREMLEQAKKQGVVGGKLNVLEVQLAFINKTENVSWLSPPQAQLNSLLEHYQSGRFGDAENLAISITQVFPKHPLSWKVLGAVLGQNGSEFEAINANQTAVALSPEDAEVHSNLGITFQKLGRLEEAEVSLRQAIALKCDYAEAHYNLGVTLQELGRLDEAEASYTQAIALKFEYAEAHNNLGNTLQELGRLVEAEASLRQAIDLKPDLVIAHYNLGSTLKVLGRLDEAKESYRHAIALKSDYSEARHMLAAVTGETTETSPRDFVERLFDNSAAKFESILVDNLEYKTPRLIAEMIIKDSKFDLLGSIMDLGCGTGLFGAEINQFCEYLEGIDLSEKMLDEAKKKNVYNRLTKQDIVAYLSSASLNFDCFISADVFVYIGDLSDVFKLIKSRNKTGGKLSFSTENYDGDGFFLEQSGRYSHSKKYIEGLCEKFGYKLRHFEIQTLRKEGKQYINGGLYLLDF